MRTTTTMFTTLLALLATGVPGVALATQGAMPAAPAAHEGGPTAAPSQEERQYARASSALDAGRYAEAIDLFRVIATEGGTRRDAATYWIAYAQFRQGQRAAALRTIAELRTGYPASDWLDDARYLEAEIRGAAGQGVEPGADDDEMRLHALNSLMHVDPERAMPILERILAGDESPQMKEKALFILLHADPANAIDILARVAREGETPDMQRAAAQYLGRVGEERALQVLDELYAETTDRQTKEAILHGFMMAGDDERLLRLAREEQEESLRVSAIQALAMSGASDQLWSLYEVEQSAEAREAILHSLAMAGDTGRLLEMARTETDPRLRGTAIQALAMFGGEQDEEMAAEVRTLMLDLYRDSTDGELRAAALQWLWMQGEAAALIELFEAEEDRDARRRIVEVLSRMDSPEAIDFLVRLIEQ